jgi:hypothetical protein
MLHDEQNQPQPEPQFGFSADDDAGDGAPLIPAVGTSDLDLAAAGYKAVRAWVKSDNAKKANRQQRHRERRLADGEKQLNLFAPDDESSRQALKTLAEALTRHVVVPADIIALVVAHESGDLKPPAPLLDPFAQWLDRCRAVLTRGGWRARILCLLLAGDSAKPSTAT